jgi:hypothetical protein
MFARAADGLPLATAALATAPGAEVERRSGRVDVL